jgi:hypothetical protein
MNIAMKNDDLKDVKFTNTYAHSGTQWARNPTCWRYMDLTSLIWILQNEKIHFTHIMDLYKYDPHEGTGGLLIDSVTYPIQPSSFVMVYPSDPRGNEKIDEGDRIEIEKIKAELSIPLSERLPEYRDKVKQWDKENDAVYISSWHTNEIDSDFMWKIYGKNEYGFALASSVQDLVKSFLTKDIDSAKLGGQFVVYPTRDELIRDNLEESIGSSAAFLIKSPQYSPENEFRVFVKAKQRVASCDMEVDLKKLIHSIRISPLTPQWAVQPLLDILNPICSAKGLPLVKKGIGSIRDI